MNLIHFIHSTHFAELSRGYWNQPNQDSGTQSDDYLQVGGPGGPPQLHLFISFFESITFFQFSSDTLLIKFFDSLVSLGYVFCRTNPWLLELATSETQRDDYLQLGGLRGLAPPPTYIFLDFFDAISLFYIDLAIPPPKFCQIFERGYPPSQFLCSNF